MMHMEYKTLYFFMQISVCTSFLVPYDASTYRFLWHFFVLCTLNNVVCKLKTNQGGPFVFSLHTNVHVQIFLVCRFPCKTAWYSSWTLQPWQSDFSASQNETSELSFGKCLFDHVIVIISKGELSITFLEWNRWC